MKIRGSLILKGFGILTLSALCHVAMGQASLQSSSDQENASEIVEVELPKPFDQKKLAAFSPFAYGSMKFFVDPDSIKIEKNDEVRVTVVTLNESGRYQGIYLGFDCDNSKYQQYAFLDDGAWRRPKTTNWRAIPNSGYNQYIPYLAKWSACKGNGRVINKFDFLDGLQGAKGPAF